MNFLKIDLIVDKFRGLFFSYSQRFHLVSIDQKVLYKFYKTTLQEKSYKSTCSQNLSQ